MKLTGKQTRYLRSLAHALTPAVQFGKSGLTPALIKEIDRNLSDHELIKVRVGCNDREELVEQTAAITNGTKAALVQVIGHIAILYRPAEDPQIQLPGAKAIKSAKAVPAPRTPAKKTPRKKTAPRVVRSRAR